MINGDQAAWDAPSAYRSWCFLSLGFSVGVQNLGFTERIMTVMFLEIFRLHTIIIRGSAGFPCIPHRRSCTICFSFFHQSWILRIEKCVDGHMVFLGTFLLLIYWYEKGFWEGYGSLIFFSSLWIWRDSLHRTGRLLLSVVRVEGCFCGKLMANGSAPVHPAEAGLKHNLASLHGSYKATARLLMEYGTIIRQIQSNKSVYKPFACAFACAFAWLLSAPMNSFSPATRYNRPVSVTWQISSDVHSLSSDHIARFTHSSDVLCSHYLMTINIVCQTSISPHSESYRWGWAFADDQCIRTNLSMSYICQCPSASDDFKSSQVPKTSWTAGCSKARISHCYTADLKVENFYKVQEFLGPSISHKISTSQQKFQKWFQQFWKS